MAATSTLHPEGLVSLEEYRNTRYRPDCDFVDGRIEDRRPPEGFYTEQEMKELFVGEYEHNRLKMLSMIWFADHGLVETSAEHMQIPGSPIYLPLAELLAKVF